MGVCIFYCNIVLHSVRYKSEEKIALPFHVIMTIINTRFSVVKNVMVLLIQQYKNTVRIM